MFASGLVLDRLSAEENNDENNVLFLYLSLYSPVGASEICVSVDVKTTERKMAAALLYVVSMLGLCFQEIHTINSEEGTK